MNKIATRWQFYFIVCFLISINLIKQTNSTDTAANDLIHECLEVPSSICVDRGSYVQMPLNKQKSLVGWWNFDDSFAYDYSGNQLHGFPVPDVGPSKFIKGYSAYFDGETIMNIKNFSQSTPIEMTMMFWVYLLEDSTGSWRTLIHKGDVKDELTPTIMLWPKERKLHVRVSTEIFWNEGLESVGTLNMRQWTHISVILSGQMVQLYINGNIDSQMILKGKIKMNNGMMHLGKDPWRPGVMSYIDDLKIFNIIMTEKEIQQTSSITNLLIGSNYTLLGCQSCSVTQAITSCPDNYHLCSYSELYSGAYLIARRNGWFKCNADVWASEIKNDYDIQGISDTEEMLKMALCCSDK